MSSFSYPPMMMPGDMAPGFDDPVIFIKQLKTEPGPFIFINKYTPDGQQFLGWAMIYDPSFMEYFFKLELAKASAAGDVISDTVLEIPTWFKGEEIRVKKAMYDLYLSSVSRVKNMLNEQGSVFANTLPRADFDNFMTWWQANDPAGAAALVTIYASNVPATPVAPMLEPNIYLPKKLYMHWKVTGGKVAPSRKLLGFGEKSWLDWAIENWLYIAAGAAGGVALGGWYVKNRAGGGMTQNPIHENMREGWGQTLKLKSGTYELHPILTDAFVRKSTAMNMRNAKKFRVSSEGINLGELHKSSGRYSWRARSYFGFQKYGNSRAQLLEWLKGGAVAEYEAKRKAEAKAEPKPEPKPDREAELAKREKELKKGEADLKEAVDALMGGIHLPRIAINSREVL